MGRKNAAFEASMLFRSSVECAVLRFNPSASCCLRRTHFGPQFIKLCLHKAFKHEHYLQRGLRTRLRAVSHCFVDLGAYIVSNHPPPSKDTRTRGSLVLWNRCLERDAMQHSKSSRKLSRAMGLTWKVFSRMDRLQFNLKSDGRLQPDFSYISRNLGLLCWLHQFLQPYTNRNKKKWVEINTQSVKNQRIMEQFLRHLFLTRGLAQCNHSYVKG